MTKMPIIPQTLSMYNWSNAMSSTPAHIPGYNSIFWTEGGKQAAYSSVVYGYVSPKLRFLYRLETNLYILSLKLLIPFNNI